LKIFISHSSKDDDYAADVRDFLVAKLPAEDKVLIDMKRIKSGDDWCAVLYHWLAICDAAVILFNRKALTSPWVRREVNILLWRKALNQSFQIVPALLGNLERRELKENGFDDVNRLQLARIGRVTETQADAEELAAEIVRSLPRHPPVEDQMAEWITTVADCLRQVHPQLNRYLEKAAQELGISDVDLPDNWTFDESHRLVASQMLGEGLHGNRLEKATAALAYAFGNRDLFERLLAAVTPSWVEGEAARRLLPLQRDRDPDRRVLVLNANREQIALQYLARATFNALYGYESIPTTCEVVGESGAKELFQRFDRAVREGLCVDNEWPEHEELPRDRGKVYYLLVHVGHQPLETVAEAVHSIHAKYSWLIIVLLVGPSLRPQADLESMGLGEATAVIPPLAAGDEIRALQLIQALHRLPEKAYSVRKVAV
jgi:hypothetical protein